MKTVLKAADGTYWVSYAIQQKVWSERKTELPIWGLLEHAIQSNQLPGVMRTEDGKEGVWVSYPEEVGKQGIQPDSQAFTLDEIELAKKMIAG